MRSLSRTFCSATNLFLLLHHDHNIEFFFLGGYDTRNTLHGNNMCQAHQPVVFGVQRLLGLSVLTPCTLEPSRAERLSFQVSSPNQQRLCRNKFRGMAKCLHLGKAQNHEALSYTSMTSNHFTCMAQLPLEVLVASRPLQRYTDRVTGPTCAALRKTRYAGTWSVMP
ncbi:hypothetical protein BU25DRAFT_255928 [Macroventuria anomochaeta]|uniref:Uncharacterized protein n=1 Tax=Macroventuria anomochaeta TaxID=301207 RepID=A0ACB6SB22_9PLEO|nr:uncharacterized protein BU25DRAFT_255928 [Macroventuria anomochaeta]KAF2630307.1 hypothetical protein BU25DRAFT_255928 [Macroventuria anomochaeta]